MTIALWLYLSLLFDFFFFKQKTAYEMRISDWSSDVCSSDLEKYRCRRSPLWPALPGSGAAVRSGRRETAPQARQRRWPMRGATAANSTSHKATIRRHIVKEALRPTGWLVQAMQSAALPPCGALPPDPCPILHQNRCD